MMGIGLCPKLREKSLRGNHGGAIVPAVVRKKIERALWRCDSSRSGEKKD